MALNRRSRPALDIWPGFVDALATLLMVIIFLLMIFVISQIYLNDALVGRDAALERLNRQIADMAEQLGLERVANEELRANLDSVSAQLRTSIARRDELETEVSALRVERNAILGRLDDAVSERDQLRSALRDAEGRLSALTARFEASQNELSDARDRLSRSQSEVAEARETLAETEAALAENTEQLTRTRRELEDAYAVVEANKETIELQLRDLDQLTNDLLALEALRDDLLAQVAQLEEQNLARTETIEEQEQTLTETEGRLQTTLRQLDEQTEAALMARAEAARLAREVAALREQMGRLSDLLEESERRDAENQAQIADLGRRLNVALASRVQELARYRSEFFGRLREILGDRQDIQIVGDRFVFQSEVLFSQGSADLGAEGQQQLAQLADTLLTIAESIPDEINWVLRVDGHTDRIPISTPRFPSNWELSTARAISVVKFLRDQGVPQNRLAATGFAEFQPLDTGDSPEALRRNRRIELKLTER